MRVLTHCPACGNEVPPKMPSCGWCGAQLTGDDGDTVNVHQVERRLFGVPPATGLLAAGCAAAALAAYLLLTGRLLLGLVMLVAGVLLLVAFPAVARRPDETPVARRTVRSYDGLRERAGATVESLAAWTGARRTVMRVAEEIERVERSRREAVLRLGEAAYAGDQAEVGRLREQVAEADAALERKRSEIEQVRRRAGERVRDARLRAQPTERLRRDENGALTTTADDGTP